MSDTTKIQFRIREDDLDRWDEFVSESMLVSNRSDLIRRAVGEYIRDNTQFSVEEGVKVDESNNREQGDKQHSDMEEVLDLLDYISAEMETIKKQTQGVEELATRDEMADVEQSLRLAINNSNDTDE
jgi:hypothetical protein